MKVYFPYDSVRDNQKELINDIFKSVNDGKTLLVNAPTGIGKTASALAPCLSYAIAQKKKVFFLTPKSSQHEIALETANLMNERFNLKIKTVDLVGKKKMCIHPLVSHVGNGFYEACNNAKKNKQCVFYSNTKGTTIKQKADCKRRKADLLTKYGQSYSQIKNACLVKELCPYEVTLEMIKNADLVIGDYFHIFNDDIRESILGSAKISLKDCILVIDEAHNLPKRVRDMLSTTLKIDDIEKAVKEAKNVNSDETVLLLGDVAQELKLLMSKIPFGSSEGLLEKKALSGLKKLAKENLELLEDSAGIFMRKNKKENSFLLTTAVFLHNLISEKEHTLHLAERQMNSFRISLYPLDPSEVTARIFHSSHSSILMSGTLIPLLMYADVLGVSKAELKEYASPFLPENRLNIFVDKTTTKYTERNSVQYDEIAEIICKVIAKVPGNVIVFFPSFEILKAISPRIKVARQVLEQEKNMPQGKKSSLISKFKQLGYGFGAVLLAVSGGSIAEGVDFPGENLKAAIIVGVPFERVSLQSKALIDFYNEKFNRGWDYAYNAPAISRAVQAAGRVIRTEKDKGVCIFLDKRFSDPSYRQFFPKDFVAIKSNEPDKHVEEFF